MSYEIKKTLHKFSLAYLLCFIQFSASFSSGILTGPSSDREPRLETFADSDDIEHLFDNF